MTLFYLFSQTNRNPIDQYLATWGAQHFRYILPVTYESLIKKSIYPAGTYIFTDIDILDQQMLNRLLPIWEALNKKGYLLLNHPLHSKRRFELLRTMHEQHINTYNVFRLDDDLSQIKFPVFLRKEDDHRGAQTDLLWNHDTLYAAINEVKSSSSDIKNWMVSEFCETRDHNDIYIKYSAFIVHNTIVPRHVFFSKDWHQKKSTLLSEIDILQKETEYLQANPHEQRLKEIFDLAGITYGRIDYGIKNGSVQVWEINTNPMIMSHNHASKISTRSEQHQLFHRQFSKTLNELHQRKASPIPLSYFSNILRKLYFFLYEKIRASVLGDFLTRIKWKWQAMVGH